MTRLDVLAIFIWIIDLLAFIVFLDFLNYLDLSTFKDLSTIVASCSVVVAVGTYFYKKKYDKIIAVLDQINFYRENIIPSFDNLAKVIKEKDKFFPFGRVEVNFQENLYFKIKQLIEFKQQKDIFLKAPFDKNTHILDKHTALLNLLEEFALRVKHHHTEREEGLESLHFVFIETIEKNIAALFYIREKEVQRPIYKNILWLYKQWKNRTYKNDGVLDISEEDWLK